MLSFRRSQRPAIHRTQLQAELGPKSSCRSAGIPSTRSVKPFRGGRLTTMLRRCGTMGRLTSESARSGSLQDQVLEGCAGRKGRRRSEPQPQASEVCETPKPQATDSIAPTEFPKLRSATGGIRLLHRSLHRYIRPSGGEDSRQVNAQARVLDRAIPEDLVKRLAKPAIHRPQMVPANQKTNRTSVPLASALQ
jgi:hypothetical protein